METMNLKMKAYVVGSFVLGQVNAGDEGSSISKIQPTTTP